MLRNGEITTTHEVYFDKLGVNAFEGTVWLLLLSSQPFIPERHSIFAGNEVTKDLLGVIPANPFLSHTVIAEPEPEHCDVAEQKLKHWRSAGAGISSTNCADCSRYEAEACSSNGEYFTMPTTGTNATGTGAALATVKGRVDAQLTDFARIRLEIGVGIFSAIVASLISSAFHQGIHKPIQYSKGWSMTKKIDLIKFWRLREQVVAVVLRAFQAFVLLFVFLFLLLV